METSPLDKQPVLYPSLGDEMDATSYESRMMRATPTRPSREVASVEMATSPTPPPKVPPTAALLSLTCFLRAFVRRVPVMSSSSSR